MESSPSVPSPAPIPIGKAHARRLREIWRSAGWPCQDPLEIELLAAGLLHRVQAPTGHESLRVTDAGVQLLATTLASNRRAFSAHEALVERVAQEMARSGRVAWRGLSLRAQVPGDAAQPLRWCVARPDVFSIRNTSVPTYVEPIVHEVKVRRADLLSDLRNAAKRAAYLDLGECWYVLGCDARGKPIAQPEEIPAECGVMLLERDRLVSVRAAQRRQRSGLPFGVWMALAKATPLPVEDDAQPLL
jgi:prepilin signal peptidase PulO-like enzyme (type II secretory pathway)